MHPLRGRCIAFRRRRINVAADLIGERPTARQSSTQGFDEAVIALPALRLRRRLGGIRQRRGAGQPETNEQRQRLVRDGDVPFQPLDLPRHAIEPPGESGFQPVGAVGRQMRGQRRLHHERLRDPLAIGVVGKLAGEIRRQAESVLGAHVRLQPHVVGRIERDLPGDRANLALHDAKALERRRPVRLPPIRIPALAGGVRERSPHARGVRARGGCRNCPGLRSAPVAARRSTPPNRRCALEAMGWGAEGVDRAGPLGRRQNARLQLRVLEVAGLLGADRMTAGDQHQFVVVRQLHHFAWRQQRSRRLLARHHQVAEPWAQAMAGIVLHRPHLGGGAERIGHALGGPLVVRREAHAHMAVVEDGVVLAVGLLDLVQRLRDEETLQAVARHEGQRALEEIEAAQRRKFVEHQQQAMAPALRFQFFRQPSADLVKDQPNERLGAADVGGRHDEVEGRGPSVFDEIADAPIALARYGRDHGIAIKSEERHGGRQHAGAFVLALVQKLARGAGDDGMHAAFAQMRRRHHRAQRRLDRALGVGEEVGDAGERLVRLGVEDMQDRADQQRMAGFLPMVPPFQRALRIDQHVRDVLDVANLPFAAAHFEQRVVGGALRIGRIEQQHAAEPRPPSGGQRPVLALDVVDDRRARPGQQRRHD